MRQVSLAIIFLFQGAIAAQTSVWVLSAPGEMVAYDPATFAVKQRVKVPAEALKSPGSISVNRAGQILFAPAVSLPLSGEDLSAAHKVWIWNGHAAVQIEQGVEHTTEQRGSNQAITESAPTAYLSADGAHLFWFANQARRLQREDVDLSITNTWQAWRSELSGNLHEELVSVKFPDCRCTTGNCEESCPAGAVWAPPNGVENFFLFNQFVAGQTTPEYKSSTLYHQDSGKWIAQALPEPLERVLDADSAGTVIVESIPDTGCCGWSNESNDQTVVLSNGTKRVVFDELATYKNPDYDVSFYTSNAKLSPELHQIAMTISATSQSNQPIQLADQGQANPEESQRIRKALAQLPAVQVKTLDNSPRQLALLPHASLVGWVSEKELLIVEEHVLVVYNVATGTRRKSSLRVEDAGHVFLR